MVKNAGDVVWIPGLVRSLEKEIVTHSSILAWEMQWTEEPGGPQSVVSQRVGQDLVTKQQQQTIQGIQLTPQDQCVSHLRIQPAVKQISSHLI